MSKRSFRPRAGASSPSAGNGPARLRAVLLGGSLLVGSCMLPPYNADAPGDGRDAAAPERPAAERAWDVPADAGAVDAGGDADEFPFTGVIP